MNLFSVTSLTQSFARRKSGQAETFFGKSGRWVSVVAILVALFLFARTAGLIHDEVHPFHHHTDQCEIFQAMAHHTGDTVPEIAFSLVSTEFPFFYFVVVLQHLPATYPAFWGRAPPKFV